MEEENNKIELLAQLIENAQDNLSQAKILMSELGIGDLSVTKNQARAAEVGKMAEEGKEQIVEGVFDGENMVGPDGKIYSITANYVSKSKLVEGDILKLTIKPDGSFVYKQIGPVERKRQVGILIKDDATGEYRVNAGKKSFKVITAAVTYYKGDPGDEVVLLTSADGSSKHAAVENIIKNPGDREKMLESGDDMELESGEDSLLNNSILEDID